MNLSTNSLLFQKSNEFVDKFIRRFFCIPCRKPGRPLNTRPEAAAAMGDGPADSFGTHVVEDENVLHENALETCIQATSSRPTPNNSFSPRQVVAKVEEEPAKEPATAAGAPDGERAVEGEEPAATEGEQPGVLGGVPTRCLVGDNWGALAAGALLPPVKKPRGPDSSAQAFTPES